MILGDEDAISYALKEAFREHVRETWTFQKGVPDVFPSANVARVFARELATRGWEVKRAELPECVGSVLPHRTEEP
jgi:hypothetical protein